MAEEQKGNGFFTNMILFVVAVLVLTGFLCCCLSWAAGIGSEKWNCRQDCWNNPENKNIEACLILCDLEHGD